MNTKSLLAGVLALNIAAAPVAWAQSSSQPSYPPRTTTDVPEDRDPAPSMQQGIDVNDLTAQELRNKPVYAKGEKVATLQDVTGTPGQAREAILEVGGVMGVGGRNVVVPLNKITVAPDGRLLTTMTEDELKLLPKAP
jgi:hypothetical protein